MDKIYAFIDNVSSSEKAIKGETNSFSGIIFNTVVSIQFILNIKPLILRNDAEKACMSIS
jgi:hypothetical protein